MMRDEVRLVVVENFMREFVRRGEDVPWEMMKEWFLLHDKLVIAEMRRLGLKVEVKRGRRARAG